MTDTAIDEPKPKVPRQEFAAKIKAKYPQYKDMDDNELVDKIVAKYPTYADTVEPLKKKEHILPLGQPGPEFQESAPEPLKPALAGSPELKFDDEADRQKSLKALDDQLADQTYRLEHPDLNYQKLGDLGKVPPKESIQLPGMQSVADTQIAAKEEHALRQTLGIDPKDAVLDRPSSAAGTFNQGVVDTFMGALKSVDIAASQTVGRLGFGEKFGEATDPTQGPAYKLADWVEKQAKELFPNDPAYQGEIFTDFLPATAAALLSFHIGGALGKTTKAAELAVPAATRAVIQQTSEHVPAAFLASASTAASEYDRALAEGADPATAMETWSKDMFTGVPFLVSPTFKAFNKATDGYLKYGIKQFAQGGPVGGFQMATSRAIENLSAQQTYDKGREILDGVLEAGGSGFAINGFLSGVIGALTRRAATMSAKEKPLIERLITYAEEQKDKVEKLDNTDFYKTDEKVEPPAIGETKGPEPVSKSPEEATLPVQGEQPETPQTAAVPEGVKPEPTPEIKPEDIHALAKEAGVDYESKEFMDKSEELTGKRHLDAMSPEELTKVKEYLSEQIKLKSEDNAISIGKSASLPVDEASGSSQEVGGGVPEPKPEGPPDAQKEEPSPAPPPEEVGVYKKGEQVDFIGHDSGERKGTVESFDPENGKYKIKASNGTIWNVEAKNIGVQTESAAAKGTKTITSPDQGKPYTQGPSKPFNMASRVKEVFAKFQIPINEGSLRKAYEGVYKYFTGGVRLHGMWDIYVAVHEGLHAFDERHNIWENVKKYGSQKLKNELLDAYDNFYPAPKKSASLKERIKEGMAMVTQYYAADQTMTEQRFPEAIKHLLQPNGQFFKPEVGDFVAQMKALADEYFSLNPEDKINARIKWAQNDSRHGMGFWARVRTQLSNDLTSAQIVDNLLGGEYRAKAIQPQVTMLRNIGGMVSNWIKHPFGVASPPQTYLGDSEWGPTKSGYRVHDYMKKLDSPENLIKFNDLLVARRQMEGYNELQTLENEINELTETDPTSKKLPSLIKKHTKLNDTLEKNKMPLELVKAAVKNLEGKFKEELKIYDALNGDLVDFMEATGMISKERADEFRKGKGYAAFQRSIEDEHLANVDDLNLSTSSKGAVKALKKYTGSAKQIIPPTYSQAIAIGEILTKGQRNVVWQAWAEAAKTSKEVAQIFEPVTALDVDPNSKDIQTVLENGVKKYYKMGEEARVFGETLTPTQIEAFSQVMRGATRVFQTGTTGAYPLFLPINVSMDAWARFAQTKTGLIPVVHDLPTIGKAFSGLAEWMFNLNKNPNEFTDFMALGGRRNVWTAQQSVNPEGALGEMLNKGWWQKTKTGAEITLQMMELPTNFSELIGRGTEYARAVQQGHSSAVAMHMAANVSIPFSNKGKMGGPIGQEVIKWMAYTGAGIQALDSFIKNAKENPKRVGSAVALAVATTAAGALLTYMLGTEDEKEMLADQLPEDYARWIYMPGSVLGYKSGLLRFRVPEQIGMVGGMTQLYFSHLFKQKPVLFKEYYQAAETILPSQLKFSQGPGTLMNFIPTAISPEIQTLTNTRFYPELLPIVPKNLQDYAEWRQYDKYTSRSAKAIGEMTADNLKISPKKFDFYIRAKFGRATQLVQSLAESAIYGDPVKSYVPMWQEYDRVAFSGRMYNKFWDIKEEADKSAKILENYKRLKNDIGEWRPLINAKQKADILGYKAQLLRMAMEDINNGKELPEAKKRDLFNMILQVVKDEETESYAGLKEEEK